MPKFSNLSQICLILYLWPDIFAKIVEKDKMNIEIFVKCLEINCRFQYNNNNNIKTGTDIYSNFQRRFFESFGAAIKCGHKLVSSLIPFRNQFLGLVVKTSSYQAEIKISKSFGIDKFCSISLLFAKHFIQDCRHLIIISSYGSNIYLFGKFI